MKFFGTLWAATCFLAAAFIFAGGLHVGPLKHEFDAKPSTVATFSPITAERKATHMITYLSEDGAPDGLCTGTAVGPHALLTALHCDEGESRTITLDLSVKKFNIIGVVQDGRDHIIYHLDGPEFKNYVTIRQKQASTGTKVISYGNGRGEFPQHTYVGTVIVDTNGGDTSEVDAADGATCFSIPAIPGDSGSAIYDMQGNIVALITYGDEARGAAVGFALNFTPEQLKQIKE